MRVLVTGASGFIGRHVVCALLRRNLEVGVCTRRANNMHFLDEMLPKITVIPADLADLSSAAKKIQDFRCDALVHLGWAGVLNKYRNEVEQLRNLRWTLELLTLARDSGCRCFVGFGSQAEYGIWPTAITEQTPTYPCTVYGAAKLCACLQAEQICRKSGMRFVWMRLFSSYGPGDDPVWMIPYVIISLLRHQRPALTQGLQYWDYLYVEDVAEAVCRAIESPTADGIFNLGSGCAYQVRAVVEQIHQLVDLSAELGFGEIAYRPDQIMHLQADISALRKATGWVPTTPLEEGLRRTVEWYSRRIDQDALLTLRPV